MIAGDRLDGDLARSGVEAPVAVGQVVREIVIERVAELLRLEHQREGRIAGDVDRLERVHLHGDAQSHGQPRA